MRYGVTPPNRGRTAHHRLDGAVARAAPHWQQQQQRRRLQLPARRPCFLWCICLAATRPPSRGHCRAGGAPSPASARWPGSFTPARRGRRTARRGRGRGPSGPSPPTGCARRPGRPGASWRRGARGMTVAARTYTEHSMQSAQSAHPSLPMMLVPSALVGPAPDK